MIGLLNNERELEAYRERLAALEAEQRPPRGLPQFLTQDPRERLDIIARLMLGETKAMFEGGGLLNPDLPTLQEIDEAQHSLALAFDPWTAMNEATQAAQDGRYVDAFAETVSILPQFTQTGMFGKRFLKPEAREQAERMLKEGKSPEEIHRATGAVRDPATGQWLGELDDSMARLGPEAARVQRDKDWPTRGKPQTLGDALDHPALYEYYPEARNTPWATSRDVQNSNTVRGAYDPRAKTVEVRGSLDDEMYRKTLLHEGGHVIQGIDGMPTGTNPHARGGYRQYREDPSEFFPHISEDRANLTAAQRAEQFPGVDRDGYTYEGLLGGAPRMDDATGVSYSFDPFAYRMGSQLVRPGAGYQSVPGKPSTVKIPGVGEVEARPIQELQGAADDYMRRIGRPGEHHVEAFPAFNEDLATRIAGEFDQMPNAPSDPTVRRSYDAMIQETVDQYNALRDSGVDFRFLRDGQPDPYAASPAQGYQDLVENGRLWVFPTEQGFGSNAAFDPRSNPLLTRVGKVGDLENATANDAFRAVHDAFGHFGPGNPFFRHKGEERAWYQHSRMYSPEARGAMTSETRGQNSWLNFGPHGEHNRTALGADTIFADQKVGLMPEWTSYPLGLLGGR